MHFWNYIAVDVVRNNQATRDNYETMIDSGLEPIPVLKPTESVDYAMELVGKSAHHRICISGSATGSVGKLWERIQKVHKLTNGKALIHGLGLMRYPTIFQLPLATVDASTMTTGSRFGTISFYDKLEGIKIIHWSDLTNKAKEQWMWKLLEYGIDIESLKEFVNYRTAAGIPPSACDRAMTERHPLEKEAKTLIPRCRDRRLDHRDVRSVNGA